MSQKENNQNPIKRRPVGQVLLILSLGFFWFKGIRYLFLGSWVPLLLIVVFSAFLLLGKVRSLRLFRITLRIWAILVILWGSVRLLLTLVHYALKPIPEAHVVGELTGSGIVLSLLVLFAGILLWIKRKTV